MDAGDPGRALRASRRWPLFHGDPWYRAAFFLVEARASARLGLRDAAASAYRRYLNLRADPEPEREPETEAARRALAALATDL
jgi:hypothetical protein